MSGMRHETYRHEDDGQLARINCSCGWKSGLLPSMEADSSAREHQAAGTTRVRYSRLSPTARQAIKQTASWIPGATIAGYVRWNFPDGVWGGDSCGCPDDCCRDGYHHEPDEDCGCLDALLNQYVAHVNGVHTSCVLGYDA